MANVSVKIGVSGVAQFKQGMKESQAAVKTLDQELKLNEAQLKLNGDAQQYMENKAELLAHKIEQQKNVVKQAGDALKYMKDNGVDKNSVAFQTMAQQMYKASTELMNMQSELEGVEVAGEDAQSGVSHMNQALQRIGTNVSFENVVNGIDKITGGLEAAAEKAVELGKKLVQAMLQGGQWADDLQTTADQWEMTPEQVYRMRQTANMIDTSAETIFQARKKLITAMGKESDKETMGAFAALGISYLEGSDANIDRVFWKAGQGLMEMKDKVARNEYAMKLFGRSWEELIPIFKTGREEYEKTMASWDWVGDQQFESLLKIDDESNKLQSSWENIQHTLEAALAPSMLEIMQTLEGVLDEFNKYLTSEEGQEMLKTLGDSVSGLFQDLANINPEETVGKITEIFDKIREGLQWIVDNQDKVRTALVVIAGGFGLLKLTTLAANIGRIITGLKGLGIGTGNQMDETQAGRPGGSYGTQSGGALVGASNWVTGALSKAAAAITMYDPTGLTAMLPMAIGDMTSFGRTLRDGGSLGEALENSEKAIEASFNQAVKNWTDYPGQLYNSLHNFNGYLSQQIWGNYDSSWMPETSPFAENLQDYYAEPMNRMTNVAEGMNTGASELSSASLEMTGAAQNMMSLPDMISTAVENAVIRGMNSVTIVVDVNEVERRVGGGLYNQVIAMVR